MVNMLNKLNKNDRIVIRCTSETRKIFDKFFYENKAKGKFKNKEEAILYLLKLAGYSVQLRFL